MRTWIARIPVILMAIGLAVLANSCMPFNPQAAAGMIDLKLYWAEYSTISSANLDGSEQAEVYWDTRGVGITGMALDKTNGKIYYTSNMYSGIDSINLDGTGYAHLSPTSNTNYGSIAVDPVEGKLYYTSGMNLYWCNLDGSGEQSLKSTAVSIYDIALDHVGRLLYWSEGMAVFSAPLDADFSEEVKANAVMSDIVQISLDALGENLYWVESTTFYKKDLSTGSQSDFFDTASTTPGGFEVDSYEGKAYWCEPTAAMGVHIYRVNMDGTGYEDVIYTTSGGEALDIALDLWP
jgi:DNA-binding beta-propeller fold protein YncE